MRVALLINPRSGAGHGAQVANALRHALERRECSVAPVVVNPREPERTRVECLAALQGSHAAAVVGGDGTLHHALPVLVASRVPLVHVGVGTENLFSRATGTFHRAPASHVDSWLACAHRGHARPLDVLSITPARSDSPTSILASLMCTIGPDASVVHRLSRVRTGAISRAAYVAPTLREACSPHLPALRITVDGALLAQREQGWLVVANLPHYARGLNPCPAATASDGLLDVAFFPARSCAAMLAWYARCSLRMQHELDSSLRGARLLRGTSVHITSDEPMLAQADGDPLRTHEPLHELTMRSLPGALKVLAPDTIAL
jgi:diacylglycerol kinase family enzyme